MDSEKVIDACDRMLTIIRELAESLRKEREDAERTQLAMGQPQREKPHV